MSVRVRFAPSPTGHLHVGGARTAIFNWLFARHHGGAFIIRVEDTDQARSTLESEAMVLEDLRWLGLTWDEGPDIGGPHAPYRQSERTARYLEAGKLLLESQHAYRCFCEEEELERKRKEAEAAGRPPHYDLTCFRMTSGEESAFLAVNKPFVIRFHVPKEEGAAFDGDVTIEDLIRSTVTWKKESLGDFILMRSDGMPIYNFCVVVDDHDMEITHVIRAEEHLTNTHRQVLIYRALGWEVPLFAHVSLILGQDRTKLSKRHGATSVNAYAEEGYLPDAMLNYLSLLGWSPPDGQEIFSREKAVAEFALDRVNSSPAVFDPQKFGWVNGQYLHPMDSNEIAALAMERFKAAGLVTEETSEAREWLAEAVELVKKSVSTLAELVPALALFFEFDAAKVVEDPESGAVLREEGTRSLLEVLVRELETATPRDSEGYHALAERLKAETGLKGKKLFMPMRLAITGSMHGPELHRVVPLLLKGSESRGLAPVIPPARRVQEVLAMMSKAG